MRGGEGGGHFILLWFPPKNNEKSCHFFKFSYINGRVVYFSYTSGRVGITFWCIKDDVTLCSCIYVSCIYAIQCHIKDDVTLCSCIYAIQFHIKVDVTLCSCKATQGWDRCLLYTGASPPEWCSCVCLCNPKKRLQKIWNLSSEPTIYEMCHFNVINEETLS